MQPRAQRGPSPEIDDATVEACRRGDPDALGRVFRQHSRRLERMLVRVVGRDDELEDMLQSTFEAAIKAFPRFRGRAAVSTWLTTIAVRTALQYLRKPARRRPTLALVAEPEAEIAPVDAQTDAGRALERIYHHLEQIKPKKRVAFVLHVVEGHSMHEVAVMMGATRTATKSRVFWARRELLKLARRDPLLREWIRVGVSR